MTLVAFATGLFLVLILGVIHHVGVLMIVRVAPNFSASVHATIIVSFACLLILHSFEIVLFALVLSALLEIEGFGELFRWLSYQDIRTSTVQSRAVAGVANGTYLFCLPGSSGACRLAWDAILKDQLDERHRPCNFAELIPRLQEV